MEADYRKLLIMHAYYPGKAPLLNQAVLRVVFFYSCLFELADSGYIHFDGDKLAVQGNDTGDPVLDRVLELVRPFSGQGLLKLQVMVPNRSFPVLKGQIELMTSRYYITFDEVRFLFFRGIRRYRVVKQELLKPSLRSLERMLVYGRKPERGAWNFALLAFEGGLFRNIFPVAEVRRKAIRKVRETVASAYHRDNQTIAALYRSMRRTLKAQRG